MENKGLDQVEINKLNEQFQKTGQNFQIMESEDNGSEFVNFQFIGNYEGNEVIYDAVIYTLRLQHNSEIFEIAEQKASERYPNFNELNYSEDENGDLEELSDEEEEIGLYMAEVMMELEEEESVKVKEHIEMDPNNEFGIGLDVGLNVDEVTSEVIATFIDEFNEDRIKLDPNLYSFQHEEDS